MKKNLPMIAVSVVFLCFIAVCGIFIFRTEQSGEEYSLSNTSETEPQELMIKYLSVGNADSILVSCGENCMLIDGGKPSDAEYISRAIRQSGAKKLDYVVCTHPHKDHMGALPAIIEEFEVGRVFCADVPYGKELFDELKAQAQNKGVTVEHPERGDSFALGDAYAIFLSSKEYFGEENDMSLILKIFHDENTFLFMADAGFDAENELLSKGISVSCDILKVAHHGSSGSTSEEFLSKSSPSYAVISADKNDMEHPADETLERLSDCGAEILRTDELGDITAVSDGKTIRFEFQKE